MRKLSVSVAVFLSMAVFASSANAALIDLQSGNVSGGWRGAINDGTEAGQTLQQVDLVPFHPAWTALVTGTWVSFMNDYSPTPPSQDPCAGSPICNNDFVLFSHSFDLTGYSNLSGLLRVTADDTADVWLKNANGITNLFTAGPAYPTDPYITCYSGIVGCVDGTVGQVALDGFLDDGVNTLYFKVFQRNGTGFGLNYTAAIDGVRVVPEPTMLFLLGAGLVGVATRLRRR